MGNYWGTVLSKAFWDSFQLFYDRPSLLFLAILGAAVTALLVLVFRGKEAFVEHVKANILIVVTGGVLTWLLVLPYFILRAPFDLSSDMQSDLQRSRERERASVIRRQAAESQLEAIKCPTISPHAKPAPVQSSRATDLGHVYSPSLGNGFTGNIQVKREIQSKLSLFMQDGNTLRDAWQKVMGKPEDVQRPYADQVRQWHARLENYLRTIPRGKVYLARLNSARKTGSGGYPMGLNANVGEDYDLLISDLNMLNEFMKDPELGEP